MNRKDTTNHFDVRSYFAGRISNDNLNSYILIGGSEVLHTIVGAKGVDRHRRFVIHEVDGVNHTAVRVSHRFRKTLLKINRVSAAYASLTQFLAEVDLRENFYELWRAHHNFEAGQNAPWHSVRVPKSILAG